MVFSKGLRIGDSGDLDFFYKWDMLGKLCLVLFCRKDVLVVILSLWDIVFMIYGIMGNWV